MIKLFDTRLFRHEIGSHFKVRGWKLSPNLYVGQAKIAGKWGMGLLVDRGHYAYGLNHERISFIMRF